MPPKKKMLPAPIDRPLSRAYLREFTGWSTAFPPGASESTSLRQMENTIVNRDGSLRIRPGLRYLSYDGALAMDADRDIVGSHEVFFLADGSKAYLFAVRETDGTVGFRAAKYTEGLTGYNGKPYQVFALNHAEIGFADTAGEVVAPFTGDTTYVKYLQIDNKILALSNAGEPIRIFWVGASKYAKVATSVTRPDWTVEDKPDVYHLNGNAADDSVTYPPKDNNTESTRTPAMLRAEAGADAIYSIAYFYTFSSVIGESAASQVKVVKVNRPWQAWKWETSQLTDVPEDPGPPVVPAKTSGEPTGVETNNQNKSADQLAIYPSEDAFDAAILAGATHFNVFALMWSDQDTVPVEGVLIGSVELDDTLLYENCWVRHSPGAFDASRTAPIPTENNRRNYTESPTAGQGLVAGDRMILVHDPNSAGVIRWSSNQLGENLNFTASIGGGYKTLTTGNLYVPAAVKLWQNPQSVDTLTILCQGVDGHSTAYYMAPGQVTSQSDAVSFMTFEETTATPGTIAPYGCEVFNNALYHPIESELMKSTASNYNINHKTMTELIANMWRDLLNKQRIVSSQLDNRLYYIVQNRYGEELEDGCWGNEIWVFDAGGGKDGGGSWSRWLVQAHSLRKIEVNGRIVMSVVRPEGIFYFDDESAYDQVVHATTRAVSDQPIPWKIETNTQGANRAHDAWAHLQQVSVIFGNFTGTARFGVRGRDLHGKEIDISKIHRDLRTGTVDAPYDNEDHLQVRRDMKEWHFYAESVVTDEELQHSTGQINLVQYRYTPVSVNVGYEYGSVETFEYGAASVGLGVTTTDGIPIPMGDTSRP